MCERNVRLSDYSIMKRIINDVMKSAVEIVDGSQKRRHNAHSNYQYVYR